MTIRHVYEPTLQIFKELEANASQLNRLVFQGLSARQLSVTLPRQFRF
jgi:hypothetical protein